MNYIMTNDEYSLLISLSDTRKTAHSSVAISNLNAGNFDIAGAKKSLENIGLISNGRLTAAGSAITSALLAPERLFETVNTAFTETPVVGYCYRDGVWTVLLPENYKKLVSIYSPVSQNEIRGRVMRNLFLTPLPEFKSLQLILNAAEAAVFELSNFIIEQRFNELGRPLKSAEQSFTASDVFSDESLVTLSVKLERLPEDRRAEVVALINDSQKLIAALMSLAEKGVLAMTEMPEGAMFVHTAMARQWLTGDAILDTIAVKNTLPEGSTEYYKLTKSGLLSVSQDKNRIVYKSVTGPRLENIPADIKKAEIKEPEKRFCSLCGGKLGESARFCPYCGAPVTR
jgi:hypothetical protein